MGKIIFLIVLIFIFFGVTILNSRIKVPDGVEMPEKCHGCSFTSCSVKSKKAVLTPEVIEQIKNDLNCQNQDPQADKMED